MMTISLTKPLCLVQSENSSPYFESGTEFRSYYNLPDSTALVVKTCGSDLTSGLEKIIGKFTSGMRWVICGDDVLFLAVVTRIMFLGKLEQHEIAFLPIDSSSIMPCYHAQNPLATIVSQPLIRDEKGSILLSPAILVPRHVQHKVFPGETYADQHKIAGDTIRKIQIEPLETAPGLRARSKKHIGWTHWQTGRAVQTGGKDFIVKIAVQSQWNTQTNRHRVSFYRHHIDMLIAR